MKNSGRLFLICLAFVLYYAKYVVSDVIRIDFGPITTGREWNTVTNFNAPYEQFDLINCSWRCTDVSYYCGNGFSGSNENGRQDTIYPQTVGSDSFYVSQIDTASVEIRNLLPAKIYSFTFFGSREIIVNDRKLDVKIDGQTLTLDCADNTSNAVSFQNISPDSAGTVEILFKAAGGSIFGYLGVIEIEGEFTVICPPVNPCIPGDFTEDCEVDIEDLCFMARQWLTQPDCFGPDCADIVGYNGIGIDDFSVLAANWNTKVTPVIISEFMASNGSTIKDGNGESSDWIELYNKTNMPIDLSGFYLTDDSTNLDKWFITPGTTINAYSFLLIFASGKDDQLQPYADNLGCLHTNFNLGADGGYLALVDSDGQTIRQKFDPYYSQLRDVSYGDYNGQYGYCDMPTPGGKNYPAHQMLVADTKFSVNRGFYTSPFNVEITCETEGAEIYYTLDGSEPTQQDTVYTEPITITTTSTLRAAAFKPGWLSSNVDTQTYIFLDDVIRQSNNPAGFPSTWGKYTNDQYTIGSGLNGLPVPADYEMNQTIVDENPAGMIASLQSLPTLSIVADHYDLFSTEGILQNPFGAVDGYGVFTGNTPGGPDYVNFTGFTRDRRASVEWIDPAGGPEFQADCGIRLTGGWSRHYSATPKKSLALLFKSEFGEPKLKFPLFGEGEIDEFDRISLKAIFSNAWPDAAVVPDYLRDNFVRNTQSAMGQQASRGTWVHLYLNGLYWGIYNPTERPDASFAAGNYGGNKDDYDAVKHLGIQHSGTPTSHGVINNQYEVVDGDLSATAYQTALNIANGGLGIMSTVNAYNHFKQYVDIVNLADYILVNTYCANVDWPHKNWYCNRLRSTGEGFKFYTWDAEYCLNNASTDKTGVNNSNTPADLYDGARQNTEFRMLFADRIHKHVFNGGALDDDPMYDRYMAMASMLEPAIDAEAARWGDNSNTRKGTRDFRKSDWISAKNGILNNFIPNRKAYAMEDYRNRGLYPSIDAPVFNINGSCQHGGYVEVNAQLNIYNPDTSSELVLVDEGIPVRVLAPIDNSLGQTWTQPGFVPGPEWTTGNSGTGVGYDRRSGYEAWIDSDVENLMYNITKSALCRIQFQYTGVDVLEMVLQMRYDDGFVAYLNGTEIYRSSNIISDIPGSASATDKGEAANTYDEFDVSTHIGLLQTGNNVLAIHGINHTLTSSDFLILPRLVIKVPGIPVGSTLYYTTDGSDPRLTGGSVNPLANEYTGSYILTKSTHLKSRILDDDQWSALNEAVYAVGPAKENLRISEIMYYPADPNTEFIELQNISSTETINLNLVEFTKGVDFVFGDTVLNPGQYVLVVQDQAAFEAKYGTTLNIAGQYTGRLDNDGDRIKFKDAAGTEIQDFTYEDNWYELTDGEGFSLNLVNPVSPDPNDWNSKFGWRSSLAEGGTPGQPSQTTLAADSIVINELLAHSHANDPDWIELHNKTGKAIDISGWFLSDDDSDPNRIRKYEISAGISIPAYGYHAFYENISFGSLNQPVEKRFGLSEGGETVYLYSGNNGQITGYYQTQQKFDASETNASFGRYEKAELSGGYDFTRMTSKTAGASNSGPLIPDIVITEIYYNPPNGTDYEFVEFYNRSGSPVTLRSSASTEVTPDSFVTENIGWRIEGTGFEFSSTIPVTIGAGDYIIIAKDPSKYTGLSCDVYGPYDGKLDNGGEELELQIPGDQEYGKSRYWIPIEKINYDDDAPWPLSADGGGDSLNRINKNTYSRDYSNWFESKPSPGEVLFQ